MSAELIQRFDQHQDLRGFSAATRRRRRWTLTTFEAETPCGLAGATLDDIEAFIARRTSPASRRAFLSDLRAFYRWAISRELLAVDPTARMELPKVPKRAPTPLTSAELELALNVATPRVRRMVMLGAFAGLRVSEIAGLHADDVWWPDHLVVRNGKGGKDRTVPLHQRLVVELSGASGPVVGTTGGHVSNTIRELFRSCGIHHRPHDLRHTFATEAAAVARGDLVLVAGLLGHESVMTTQRYVGYRPEGAEIVAGMFAG